ncbi:MAG: hypothetical protein ACI8QS_000606 [Planctomycetota bacterium]|jgi:hypothetical protein
MFKPTVAGQVPSGGTLPDWMRLARRWMMGLSVVLGLGACAGIWWMRPLGPMIIRRRFLPRQEEHVLETLMSPPLLFFGVGLLLVALVVIILRLERGREERFEPFLLVGTLLIVLGNMSGALGAWAMAMHGGYLSYRIVLLDVCLGIGAVGSVLLLRGLIRVARNPALHGAVVGICALMTSVMTAWWIVIFLVTPNHAQVLSDLEDMALPTAATTSPWYSRWSETQPIFGIPDRYNGDQPLVLLRRKPMDREDWRAAILYLSNAEGLDPIEVDDTWVSLPGRTLQLRGAPSNRAGVVLELIEYAQEAGIRQLIIGTKSPFRKSECGLRIRLSASDELARSETIVVELQRADGPGEERGTEYRMAGRKGDTLQAVLPGGYVADSSAGYILAIESELTWQDAVTAIEAAKHALGEFSIRRIPTTE